MRLPTWSRISTLKLNGQTFVAKIGSDGYASIQRKWTKGDKVQLDFKLEPKVVVDAHNNAGKIAIMYGPLVLAADERLLGKVGTPINCVSVGDPKLVAQTLAPQPAPDAVKTWTHAQVFPLKAIARLTTATTKAGMPMDIQLIPFADAGAAGQNYKIWLPLRSFPRANVLVEGLESRSRPGDAIGSINDEYIMSWANTHDNKLADEDWYAVTLDEPHTISYVLFAQGKTYKDGGWFDASSGKPRIQIQTSKNGEWKDAGELKEYPQTTAPNAMKLHGGEIFDLQLPAPAKAFGVRVIGKPACGERPNQAFSACAELQAFEKKPS